MVALLGENTLLLMRPSDRGQLAPQLLEEVENMPRDVKPGLTKVKVGTANQNGQVRFTLPAGDTFLAKPTQQIPAGSTALVNIKADGSPPQVLRVILPPAEGQAPALQQTTSPSVLLGAAKTNIPQVGAPLQLQPFLAASTQQERFPALPSPGGQVLGTIQSPPAGGSQTLMLANRTPLLVANPPVFEVGSDVTLRLTGAFKAVLENLTLPQNSANNHGNNLGNNRSKPLPNPTPNPTTNTTPQEVARQPSPLLQLRPLSPPSAQQQRQTNAPVTIARIDKNIYTLKMENGLELKARPIRGQGRESGGENQTTTRPTQSTQQATQQATINTLTTGSKMSVRFTENGVLDVLRVAEPHTKLPPKSQQQQGSGNQTGHNAGKQNTPNTPQTTVTSGHIATGNVTEQKPDGRLMLQFNKGVTIEVQAQRLLPVGSQISVHIMPDGHAEIIDISLPKGTEQSNRLLRYALAWDGLNTTLDTLAQRDPSTHEKMVNMLPRTNENLLPQLIQFSNAVANQSLQDMFGDEILNVLRALGLDGMLQTDMSQLNTLQQQRPDSPDSWRALLFPYWDEQEENPKQGGFFWRRQHKDDSDNTLPDEGTLRFVMNVALSELGHTQLDGLMQEHQNLHLKIRTQQALSEEEKTGLRTLFDKSLNMLGLNGTMHIKNTNFFEVDPVHDILHTDDENHVPHLSNQFNVEA